MNEREAIEAIEYASAFNSDNSPLTEALDMAISALEKQIPKKPILSGLYACPNCNVIMLQGAFQPKGKCCAECGQKLDWSNEGSE